MRRVAFASAALAFCLPAQWVGGASAAVACLTAATDRRLGASARLGAAIVASATRLDSTLSQELPHALARLMAHATRLNARLALRKCDRPRSRQSTACYVLKKHCDECGTGDAWQAGHDAVIGCCVPSEVTLCVSGIVRAVHQSSSKLGDTPLVRLGLFESLPSRRFGCRASTTNSTAKSRSTIALQRTQFVTRRM